MTASRIITPVQKPVRGTIRPPGSKSITNRALILAALAEGKSKLTGVLDSQDTRVMIDSLRRLGFEVTQDRAACSCSITGHGGKVPSSSADLWLENSGTSIRFLASLCALGTGSYRLDGVARMRERPIGDLVRALRDVGATIEFEIPDTDCPPILVHSDQSRIRGGRAVVDGSISSQFLSSLLMSLPSADHSTQLDVSGTLVSMPYVTMTLQMMESFEVSVRHPSDLSSFDIQPAGYQAQNYEIEPDASAATYLWGAAAVTGGSVKVSGLHQNALQGDVAFVDALEQMGCNILREYDGITVSGHAKHGIDIDMNAISDTAQTLATVAVFADSPTTIRNVEHMRHKETDRVAAVVAELTRAGIEAEEMQDGLRIHPGTPQPTSIQTYDDHRMAMSFSLLGLREPGIAILDPDCTAKTYPHFFDDLETLCRGAK
jgi:3-phosphoshikimate 1-carboxyvinyltransferase